MNGTEYQQTISNCQHWTATFLYSLLNLANCTPYRYFEVFDQNILALILHVVNVQPNGVWHLQNEFIVTAVGVLAKLLA
ncbi:hypothetical protein FRC14_005557 [Serendipita sp. 396]|nr:hypothetical protein FRC14_005557 [Serendipita sp. 396]KAG8804484.1 hypothetical protein FRC16_007893 [Serendipita sp. 398]KAG8820043.1 hypothetical protein FRC18_011857 [Serendipita sp. 400]KAG8827552.1 hypothetical protein FRC19_002245 [Serendipita sp. 401]KAG9057967.1 hypothetical protein FS842_002659 [Serendipita sp. 407]